MRVETHINKTREFPAPIRIERLRFDARDRWIKMPAKEAAAELAAQFGDLDSVHQLLSAGHELQTAYAQYRKSKQ